MTQRAEVDGVPVHWHDGPEPLSAGLLFRVGRRDETLATGGVSHLVEHLVMGALPKRHYERNASVDTGSTEFTCTGRPEQVAEFLLGVCEALADLPLDRLETERRVLAAEESSSGPSVLGELMLARYGARGLGLAGMGEPALQVLTADQVRAHARAYFSRGNAALWLTGPPPEGLRLPLPDGPRASRPEQPRLDRAYPARRRYEGPFPAVGVELPSGEAAQVLGRVARERMEDELRHRGGHSYDVDVIGRGVSLDLVHVGFFADGTEEEVPAVLRGLHRVLVDLAAQGPTHEELAHDLDGQREANADPRSAAGRASDAAMAELVGRPARTYEQLLEDQAALTPADVAEVARAAVESALVLLPDTVDDDVLGDLPLHPELSPDGLDGREVRRRFRSDAPRGSRLVLAPEGVGLRLPDGSHVTVRYGDAVAVAEHEADHRHLELVNDEGLTLPVCEEDWRGGAQVLDEVERGLAGVERFRVPHDD